MSTALLVCLVLAWASIGYLVSRRRADVLRNLGVEAVWKARSESPVRALGPALARVSISAPFEGSFDVYKLADDCESEGRPDAARTFRAIARWLLVRDIDIDAGGISGGTSCLQ